MIEAIDTARLATACSRADRSPRCLLVVATACLCLVTLMSPVASWAQAGSTPSTNSGAPASADETNRYSDGLRRWTPALSTAIRYFGNQPIQFSGDRSLFLVLEQRGDLACDCNVSKLSVYKSEEIAADLAAEKAVPPGSSRPFRVLIRRQGGLNRSKPYQSANSIQSADWDSDGESIVFQGLDDQSIPQLYRYQVQTEALTQLTHWTNDVLAMRRAGKTIVSAVWLPETESREPDYPIYTITPEVMRGALSQGGNRLAGFVSYGDETPWEIKNAGIDTSLPYAFSDDGSKVILATTPTHTSRGWIPYNETRRSSLSQFYFVDAKSGHGRPLFDAPLGEATLAGFRALTKIGRTVLWAKDQRHVILVNTSLPVPPTKAGPYMAYIADYNIESGKWSIIEPVESPTDTGSTKNATQVAWLDDRESLFIGHSVDSKPASGTVYSLRADRWVGRTVPPSFKAPTVVAKPQPTQAFSVKVRQSANDPPAVVATASARELILTAPDPALDDVWRAKEERIEWKLPNGRTLAGGLLLPREQHGRLPLVVQAYAYLPDEFAPDGPTKHAYAAQSLVAKGIAVLNINIPAVDTPNSSLQHAPFIERFESAVAAVVSRGIVDEDKVGLIGFSNAGFHAYYLITHPGKIKPATVVIDDALTGGFSEELLSAAAGIANNSAALYDGTFWQKKQSWLAESNTFNVDRVQTPAMFAIHHQRQIADPVTIETIGAFAFTRRPLEYLVIPYGSHTLGMPRQRLASQTASVDWMAFWLTGALPTDRTRAERWSHMRTEWERQQAWERAGNPVGSQPPQGTAAH